MKTKTDLKFEILPTGFTLVEILVVIAIIALLLGILLPALTQIKKIAANTKQKAQISSIEIGLSLYKNDFGEYPPSHGWDPNYVDPCDLHHYAYSGAQTLAEAMVGYDLLGFDPNSKYDPYDTEEVYTDPNNRKGPYLDRTNIGVFTPDKIFDDIGSLNPNGHMICDVFPVKSKQIGNKRYKIGTPILYFQANLSPVNMQLVAYMGPTDHENNIYNLMDNWYLMGLKRITDGKPHNLSDPAKFYKFITDPTIPSFIRPHRPDTFLLISAGWDGLYGTSDDICNFEPNIE